MPQLLNNTDSRDKEFLGFSGKSLKKAATISVLITAVLLGVVLWHTDWDLLWSSLLTASLGWVYASVTIMVVLQFVSGLRLAYLFTSEGLSPLALFGKSVEISFQYQALIKILPFRLGDAAFFWLVKQKINTPFEKNLGIFLHFRLWDLRAVAICFIVCGGWLFTTRFEALTPYILTTAALGIVFFMLSPAFLVRLAKIFFAVLSRISGLDWLSKVETVLGAAHQSIVKESTKQNGVILFMLTTLLWTCFCGVFYCLMKAIGMDISPLLAVAVVSGMTLASIIPIQTVGGVGLIEIGQSSLYVLSGLSVSEAASRSLTISILFLGLCLVVPATLWALFAIGKPVLKRNGQLVKQNS